MGHWRGVRVTGQSTTAPAISEIGESTSEVSVEISTRFLEHFSEQLY
jgi:hypothetical protein